jgi:hypothetical protein
MVDCPRKTNPERRLRLARRNRERRPRTDSREPSAFDRARDELFHAIRQCGVLTAPEDEQTEWMEETVRFLAERHQDLAPQELEKLKHTGLRFCQPVIPHGAEHTALSAEGANAA